jgi:hypothetical protein
MSTTIDVLELEIQSNAKSAVSGIDALTQSLTKLRNATKGGLGLSGIASQIKDISSATASINPNSSNNVSGLAKALGTLGGIKIPSSIAPESPNYLTHYKVLILISVGKRFRQLYLL